MIPYSPRITDRILPIPDVAVMSPKPIVVTSAKQYHSESQKLSIPGSKTGRIKENATMRSIIPNRISAA